MARAVLYLRVSTKDQTTENQRLELQRVAAAKGWTIAAIYEDEGISGTKGRRERPSFDRLLKDAVRAKFEVVMAWDVSRLGRSLAGLVEALEDLHSNGVDLYLHQQALDTTTPSGKALFQMCGVFAEFERALLSERVKAGLRSASAKGVKLGRPRIVVDAETIRKFLKDGLTVREIAEAIHVSTGKAQALVREARETLSSA